MAVFAFLDGPSAAGKTTLAMAVCELDESIEFIPRMTTRAPRAGQTESEYVFVDRQKFDEMRCAEAFVEYRDYEFGMSYGLLKAPVDAALKAGRNALAIVNLGRAQWVREAYPDCVAILIHVSSGELRRRLEERGVHSDDQIEERLANAATSNPTDPVYDLVVDNDGDISAAAREIAEAIRRRANA